MKRPAAAAPKANPQKKANVATQRGRPSNAAKNPVKAKCEVVAGALQEIDGFSDSTKKMLVASTALALSPFSEDRHPHQAAVVGWIQEALLTHKSALEKKVAESKALVDGAGAKKEGCEAASLAAEEALSKLQGASEEAKTKSSEARDAADAAKQTLKSAQEAQASLEEETASAKAKKEELESILAAEGSYSKMKTEVAKKKEVDAFVRTLKKNSFELTLCQTLAPVLCKEPASRTEFDNCVLANLEESVTAQIKEQDKVIENVATAETERAAAVSNAQTALDAAKSLVETTSTAKGDADRILKEGEAAAKAARTALKACDPEAKQAANATKAAEVVLAEFCDGPLTVFTELRERTAPVEEPPAENSAPPAEVAADTPDA